ncbi:MAG: LD-carboxypeptidase [Pseudobacteriovorax sp.]|nr:LD-carboxypeptidase [Pseudobacteriovorax sp.]
MIRPKALKEGDTVAAVSMSWGGPEAVPHRFERGKKQLEEEFGWNLIAMEHTLKPDSWLTQNPEARAADMMNAFKDPSIKGIIATIGGDDSVRLIPHFDYEVIRQNPKVFLGYSDTTVSHFACFKAGLTSFYGPSILSGFAENGGMFPYMVDSVRKTMVSTEAPGVISPNPDGWTVEFLDWNDTSLQDQKRKLNNPSPWRYLGSKKKVSGKLIGGCADVLEMIKGTEIWPSLEEWEGKILFLETSEDAPSPTWLRYWLRNYAATGILERLSGILLGRPGGKIDPSTFSQYDDELCRVVLDEAKCDIPLVTQMDFGHTDPMFVLPIGAMATIDPIKECFSIDEAMVE